MSTQDKVPAYKVTTFVKGTKKVEYTFAQLKEAIMFQVGLKKQGHESNLTRVEI